MKKQTSPRAAFSNAPFVNGFTDIEKENLDLVIGSSDEFENLFSYESPEYIKLICKLSVKSEFPNVTISAGYKVTEDGELQMMQKNLYDGSEISMNSVISEIEIEFLDFQQDFGIVKKSWKDLLIESPVIYKKEFPKQTISRRIDNFIDNSVEQNGTIHTKSKAHFFGGSYFGGIKFSDIQPYLFYVGTGLQAEEYINIISAKEVFQNGKVKLSPEIQIDSLSTLEDDICNGTLKLNLDDEIYKSVIAIKETLTSNVFQILFKKEN